VKTKKQREKNGKKFRKTIRKKVKKMVEDFELKRKQLVQHLQTQLFSEAVLEAFSRVKRECFVPEKLQNASYIDDALPIGNGQTISQPSTIAQMLELLETKKGMKILEVGSGSGYVLGLLKEMVGRKGMVFGVELLPELVEQSKKNLACNGTKGIELKSGDGSVGWKEKSPFDRILISAACPFVPKPLFEHLKEGGIALAPVGDPGFQTLTIMKKANGKPFKKEFLENYFVFVPLRGEYLKKIREKIEC
jgi:protein-L-isoaspartate(D-aspartate) O-methyltransferase